MVQVTVTDGILEGEKLTNEYGGTYYSFKGIPYAAPPIEDLRYKPPQPVKSWNGVRDAKKHGPRCSQYDLFSRSIIEGSEDCLYINVYTPDLKPSQPLPVMFWIHGGGFLSGSGDDDMYGPEFLMRKDVILVTFNYRLDIVGFLCLDTEDIPGNAGMKDQVAALRWVRSNIKNFGGDPDNVTILGESAGAACVCYHLVSPMTKGLFKRAIAQSGDSIAWWTSPYKPKERALAIAKTLGCKSTDIKEVCDFYKSLPMSSLIAQKTALTFRELAREFVILQFSVVSEKQFGDNERYFYGTAADALRNGIHEGVEVITGITEDEGYISLCLKNNLPEIFNQANNFPEFFVPQDIAINNKTEDVLEIGRMIKEFYFKDNEVSMETFPELVQFLGAELFNSVYRWTEICAKSNPNKLYYYKFTCKSERNVFSKILGVDKLVNGRPVVSHCDDLTYLFSIKYFDQGIDSETFRLIDNITSLWTNFAKHGNPTPDNSLKVKWEPYSVEEKKYLEIGNNLVSKTHPDKKENELWTNIYKKYSDKF